MAKPDAKDFPPPYNSVIVHDLPPLKASDEAVYGVGPGLTPPTQPHYIPRYTSPQVVAPVTQPASSNKKRCCETNSRFYGGMVGVILLLALLALAIWIGVRYGTRMAEPQFQSYKNEYDVDNMPTQPYDTCPNSTVYCDGVDDCKLGTDETNCVRFSVDNSLEMKTHKDGRFLPVCFSGWEDGYSQKLCTQLGFRTYLPAKAKTSEPSIGLKLATKDLESPFPMHSLMEVSSTCPDQKTVSLQCVDCGKQQPTSRIIGGTAAKAGHVPWQLSIELLGVHMCGAALISPDYALTAAHCIALKFPARFYKVYGGTHSLDDLPEPYEIEKILIHAKYNDTTNDHDIALIKFASSVTFNANAQPVCLPNTGQTFNPGVRCVISGFGATEPKKETMSKTLMEVDVDLINREICNGPKSHHGRVNRNMICAGSLQGGKDACQGDSGGPLVCQDDNRWYLVGVTSWGVGCGEEYLPGVYTNVRSVLPWIYSQMQQEGF